MHLSIDKRKGIVYIELVNGLCVRGEAMEIIKQDANIITANTFEDFIRFLDVRPASLRTYRSALRYFGEWLKAEGITRPGREDLHHYKQHLTATHGAAATQLYITVVRLFFAYCEQEGLYQDIARHLKGVQVTKGHKKDYFAADQLREILEEINRNTLKGKRDFALLLLIVSGGLRTIEAARANIEDLTARHNSTVLYIHGKGREGKEDYIKVMPEVNRALRDYLRARGETSEQDPLFISLSGNSYGERLTTRSISAICKARFKAAGYNSRRLTAHSLRHTAVTLSLLEGADVREVQQFARHNNIATTLIYAHDISREGSKCEELITKAILDERGRENGKSKNV